MPRGRFPKHNTFNRKDYPNSDDHDDRHNHKRTQRRVAFKEPSKFYKREFLDPSRFRSEMNDILMHESTSIKRRRRGSPVPRGKFSQLNIDSKYKLGPSTFGWYQVTIPYGQKYRKEDLIRNLLEAISPEVFIPQYWKDEKTTVVFYVDDAKIAQLFQNKSGKVQMADGFRLNIRVRSGVPHVDINDQFKERVKQVMETRYNPNTKALDMSQFYADAGFKDMFCALYRSQVMSAVLDIIATNIPHLEALNLNNNRLTSFEGFRNIENKVPNLKILYLGENRISSLGSLAVFRDLPIVELVLSPNPITTRFKDESHFVREVRRKFPQLLKLDGKILEPQIGFDVEENKKLPPPVASYFCNAEGVDIVREFLKQYFAIYDSDKRDPLVEAYHENAMLSLSLPLPGQSGRLMGYQQYNRNLLRTNDKDSRTRLIKHGRLPVVSFLTELPKTQHDLMSFTVDLSIFTPSLIVFTVGGLFKEIAPSPSSSSSQSGFSGNGDIRFFQRNFVIVPGVNGGFCIRNEMILINNATYIQCQKAFKQPEPIIAPVSANSITSPAPGPSLQNRLAQHGQPQIVQSQMIPIQQPIELVNPITPINDETKMQMVQAMCERSGMNLEWSKKCLEETNWNFENAVCVFDKVHKENKIPPEAFVK